LYRTVTKSILSAHGQSNESSLTCKCLPRQNTYISKVMSERSVILSDQSLCYDVFDAIIVRAAFALSGFWRSFTKGLTTTIKIWLYSLFSNSSWFEFCFQCFYKEFRKMFLYQGFQTESSVYQLKILIVVISPFVKLDPVLLSNLRLRPKFKLIIKFCKI
jgi:hypothetical protein